MIKWIGQHIWDFVSRFRNDVYLENIADGTVENDKFLGLDSTGKIVKETVSAGTVNLASGVTGTLPVANGGTGATTLADQQILIGNGTGAIETSSYLTFTSAASLLSLNGIDATTSPSFQLLNANANSGGPQIKFENSPDGEDGDVLGTILFHGHDDGSNNQDFAKIVGEIATAADGQEGGLLRFQVAAHDGGVENGLILQEGNVDGEVDVTLGNGSASLTTITGNATVTGSLTLGGHSFDDIDIGTEFVDTDDHIMSSGAIKEKIESYGYSTTAGTITGVTITTDSGGGSAASDTSGSADFSILGSNGVGVTNSGTTITAQAVPGEIDHDSLNNFVAAEHYDWSSDISGTAVIHANNYTNTTYSEATSSAAGLMSTAHHDKLDGIEASADVTDATNVTAAGALMDSELTDLAGVKGVTISTLQPKPSEGAFANGDKTKLDGIAAGAQVNVATNLTKTVSGTGYSINSSTGDNIALSLADTDNWGLMSDEMFDKLDGIATGAQVNVATNLANGTVNGSGYQITSSTGTNVDISAATTSAWGMMTDEDKTKLDGIEAGATADQTQSDINGLAITTVGTISSGTWQGTAIAHDYIGLDAIDGTNIADDSINSEHYVDGSIDTAHIGDDQVTYAKIQNVSATDRILGRDSAGAGEIEEITPANLRTMINVADGANAYTHPNHTGEVTSTADGATVIADDVVDEANLKISNAGSDGNFLSKQSGDTGGLTWAAIPTLNQDTTGNADTATLAMGINVSANNTSDETVYPIFVDGATGAQGAESDTGLTYNPSSGMLTTTGVTATFTGDITGNVTGNTSGSSGSCTGNAATATALATARAFQTNLGSTSSANFDGTAANTHGVTGTLAVGNGGTGQTSVTAFKNVLDDETWSFANNVTLAGFVLDSNTITGVDDSDEFTDDDAHIMTSAAINDRFAQINADTTGQAGTVATIAGLAPNTATTQANQPNITTMTGVFTGSANQLITDDGDGTVTSESTLTYDNGTLTATSSTDELPHLILDCTHAGSGGPVFSFKNNTTGEDNDGLGRIYFSGDNAADQSINFASITGSIATAADGDEAGKLNINVAASNDSTSAERQALTATGHATNDIVDVDIAYGATSTTTVAGNLNVNGEDLILESATASKPMITLKTTHTHGGRGGELRFVKDAADTGDGEALGFITWYGDDDAGNNQQFIKIKGEIEESGSGTEGGKLTFMVASHNGSETAGLVIEDGNVSGEVDVTIGGGTASLVSVAGDLAVTSNFRADTRFFSATGSTDGEHQGDVVFFGGTTSMTVGKIYHYKSDGTWEIANADAVATSDGLLGVALGAASDTNGVLLRGMVTLDHDPGAVGDVLYLQSDNAGTPGEATATAPSANNNVVRVVGYCLDASSGAIWFNPDNTFVEVTA